MAEGTPKMKIAAALIALMLAGCATVSGPSTVSSVIDKATKSYQSLYCKGLIPPDVAAQVAVQHLEYRRTMDSTHNAAVTAKDGKGAFIAAKESASRFIDVVQLALTKKEIDDLRSQLEKATKL
jgi:PBP1b-binding outer membrane lipoprotein LpoB